MKGGLSLMLGLPLLAAALFCAERVHAGTLTRSNYGGFEVRGSGNTWSFGNAKPMPGDIPFSEPVFGASGGNPNFTSRGSLPIPSSGGRSLPVDVTARVTRPSAAKAIGRFAAKVATPLVVGMAVYDLAKDLGLLTRWNADKEQNEFYTQEKSVECQDTGPGPAGYPPSPAYTNTSMGWSGNPVWRADGQCNWGWDYGPNPNYSWAVNGYFTPLYKGAMQESMGPEQLQDLEDWIASHSGWPTSATRALEDATKAGEPVEHETPTVSGPAKVDGPVETKQEPVTKKNPDGSTTSGTKTTTSTTNYINNYNNNTVTITTNVTSTRTTVYEDGTTETDTDEQTSEPSEEADFTDKPLPQRPKLYEPKYPDGPKGVWDAEVAKIKASPLFQLPSKLAPNLGDSGGCPKWSVPLNFGIANFGTQDVSLPCGVWAFLRVCCIVGALFLARALIFGG